MAFAFVEYDPDDYSIIFSGIPFEGFAKDTRIIIEFDSDGFQDEVGADGRVVRYKISDRRATITATLMASSPTNKVLSAAYNADIKATNGVGVGPFLMRDSRGVTTYLCTHAWILRMPNFTLGDKLGNYEWKLRAANLDGVVG